MTGSARLAAVGGAGIVAGMLVGYGAAQGSAGSGAPVPAPSATIQTVTVVVTPAPTPTPTPPPSPLVFEGSGSKVLPLFHLDKRNYRFRWEAQGRSNFIVELVAQTSRGLVNEILPNPSSGETLINSGGGDFSLEIKASQATWKLTIEALS